MCWKYNTVREMPSSPSYMCVKFISKRKSGIFTMSNSNALSQPRFLEIVIFFIIYNLIIFFLVWKSRIEPRSSVHTRQAYYQRAITPAL